MFKFTRYFFIVFVITTIIPLAILALWSNNQIDKIENKSSQHMVDMATKHILSTIEQHLKTDEGIILENINNISNPNPNEKEIREAISNCEIKFIYNNSIKKIDCFYNTVSLNDKYQLIENFYIPLRSKNIKGLIITKPADFSNFDTKGPFIVEFYKGNSISKNTFLTATEPKIINPPPHEMMQMEKNRKANKPEFKRLKQYGIPKDSNIKYSITELKDKDGNITATLLIKTLTRTSLMGKPPIFRNSFNLIIILAGFTLSFLVALFINKNFITPLIIIANATKEVQNGNLSIQIETDSNQAQIMSTFKNFNSMVKGLKEKESLRNSYIASLTHDLRTPIIAQQRALGLISKTFQNLNLEEEANLAKSIERNSQHLLRLVNLILESYQFSQQKIELEYTKINLKKTVDECFEKVKSIAEDKNISLVNSIDEDFQTINADKISIDRILINLIYNAIENIENDSFVNVNAIKRSEDITITVEDNGPGIAQSELDSIFEMYYTGKSIDRKLGSGLGLDVCKKLIKMHNGEIKVESELGKFTKFTITLPN